MKKVLQVVSVPHRGGAETMIMNVLRQTDHDKIQYDFISHTPNKSDYDEEINSYGGKVIHIPSLGTIGIIRYIKKIMEINSKYGPYDIIHSHTNLQSAAVMLAAKLCNIKIRITHSHNTNWGMSSSVFSKLLIKLAQISIKIFSTEYFACGKEAAIAMYGEKDYKKNKVKIIQNGIDIDEFIQATKHKNIRNKLRKEMNINEKSIVIGHIGRYHHQKNHEFIIELGKKLKKDKLDFRILLVGTGDKFQDINKQISKEGLQSEVLQLGSRSDTPELYSVFDLFILPSRYEGLPLVMIEAQSSGKQCLVSDKISTESDMGLGLVEFLPIDRGAEPWLNAIKEKSFEGTTRSFYEIEQKISNRGFSSKTNAKILHEIYMK